MNSVVFSKILENERLLNHLKEHSYWLKELNRNPSSITLFEKQMKVIYKERPSDRINGVIDNIDIISSLIDTLN